MRQKIFDLHNTAATTVYSTFEPSAATDSRRAILHLIGSGGVTYTIECTGDDRTNDSAQLSADVWQDVTATCPNLTGVTAASYVDTNAQLDVSHLLAGRWRLKRVTSDATNDCRAVLSIGPGTPVGGAASGAATAAGQAAATLLTGTVRNATTPTKADLATGAIEVNRRGSVFVSCSARHRRRLDLTVLAAGTGIATGYASFAEGPCDALRVDTDNVIVFAQPPERALIASQSGADWTGAAGWSRNGNVWTHAAGGGTGDLEITPSGISTLGIGETYAVVYTVTISAGTSVTEKLGTGAGTARTVTGTYVKLITCAGSAKIIFTPTNDLACTIDVTSVYVIPPTAPLNSGAYEAESAVAVVAVASAATPTTPHTTAKVWGYWTRRAGAVELT